MKNIHFNGCIGNIKGNIPVSVVGEDTINLIFKNNKLISLSNVESISIESLEKKTNLYYSKNMTIMIKRMYKATVRLNGINDGYEFLFSVTNTSFVDNKVDDVFYNMCDEFNFMIFDELEAPNNI